METRDFNGTVVNITGADDVTDDEIRHYIRCILKYADPNVEEIELLNIDIDSEGEVALDYVVSSSGAYSLKGRFRF